ncbi:MAG: AAA domain-containing protein [Desertimonas sp.]
MTLEAADGLVDYDDQRLLVLQQQTETLISSGGDDLPLSDDVRLMAQQLTPGEVLQYGWPTVVMADSKGVARVAPLLVTELERPMDAASDVKTTAEPFLNPSVMSVDCFDAADLAEVSRLLDGGVPVGQPDALAFVLDRTARALGFAPPSLDPQQLEDRIPNTPGLYNAAVVIRTTNAAMTQALVHELAELEDRTDWQETAARHLFEIAQRTSAHGGSGVQVAPVALNDSQEQVVSHAMDAPVTVATGPPGTGKSQLVVAAVCNGWMRDESTLVVSTNNGAVDVAVERATALAPPLLLRTGNKTFRTNVPTLAGHIMAWAETTAIDEAVARRDLALASAERQRALDDLEAQSRLRAELADHLDLSERAARDVWGTSGPVPDDPAVLDRVGTAQTAWLLKRRRRRRVLRAVRAEKTATFEALSTWATQRREFRAKRKLLDDVDRRVSSVNLADLDARWVEASLQTVRARAATRVRSAAAQISALGVAPSGGPGFANAVHRSMRGLPAWGCTALSLRQNFPLQPALFDRAIVDEASQCTLAAMLPAAYRARRLLVIGDPNQLNPIVKLNESLVHDVATSSGLRPSDLTERSLDYTSGSAFNAFANSVGLEQVHLLDEHFRCHPVVARWFNQTFYGGRLTILTDVTTWSTGARGLQWVDVDGIADRTPLSSTINRTEADTVLDHLASLMNDDLTIGVVTPFRSQAQLISRLAEQRFGGDRLAPHDFTAGTAHRFQGDERDVILFSTVVAPGIAPTTARWVEQQRNLVNVAASRARRALVVFGHPTAAAQLNVPTLASLRSAAIEGPATAGAAWAVHSTSEARLLESMHDCGLAPALKPYVEGFELDFAIVTPSVQLNIEVDGSQHLDARGRQHRQDLVRDRVLTSLGWIVVRVPAWRCLEEPRTVAMEIARLAAPPTTERY